MKNHESLKPAGSPAPPVLLGRALRLWARKRVVFSKESFGKLFLEEEPFSIFRKVIVLQENLQPATPGALLKVKFQFANFSFMVNKRLSLIPIPLIIAQPGFISKTWLVGTETGCFLGLYEWESRGSAENYLNSFPLKLMKKRARPDSLQINISGFASP